MTNVMSRLRIGAALAVSLVIALSLTACGDSAGSGSAQEANDNTQAGETTSGGSPMEQTLAFVEKSPSASTAREVAYIAACTNNPYCQTQLEGMQDAADKYNVKLRVFDSNFSPDAERRNVQDAVGRGFDGYVFMPVADSSGCAAFKLLQSSGKPVATANSPMCGDPDYTSGAVGFVAMQTQDYFTRVVDHAFESCADECEAIALGGFVGSDLFTRWEEAIKEASGNHPNVEVVVDQPSNFDPRVALQKTQDALRAHPDANLIVSSWDDMTRGAARAVEAAGKKPGEDVLIHSIGGTQTALDEIRAGRWTSTAVLLPYEEGFYPLAQLVRKLETGEDTPGFANLAEAPAVSDGPGSVFVDKDNADQFEPRY